MSCPRSFFPGVHGATAPRVASRLPRLWRVPLLLGIVALAAACSERSDWRSPLEPNALDPDVMAALHPTAGENVALAWNGVLLEAVSRSSLGPPMVARALAVVHTAMFDAWAAYDDLAVGTRLGGTLRRPQGERSPERQAAAISVAAYLTLTDLFPLLEPSFRGQLARLGHAADLDDEEVGSPGDVGRRAAEAILLFRHHDGANQQGDLDPAGIPYADYTGYAPRNTPDRITDPNAWQPLAVPGPGGATTVQRYLGPHWNRVIPFALASADEFRPPPPARFPHGSYRAQAEEIIQLTARLTERQKVIADYWADGPRTLLPPGHWMLFGRFVSARDEHDLDRDVVLFFMLANAVFDAGIAAWDAKIHYDYVRPITAIRYLKEGKKVRGWPGWGGGLPVLEGEAWMPYQPVTFPTPPFAEYVSGHSTFSAAAAEVLRRFSGSDAFGMSVVVPPGGVSFDPSTPSKPVVLSWPTFSAAADEAGMSRRYGGIHFRAGDLEGRHLGRLVGAKVHERALRHLLGTAAPPSPPAAGP
jgi:hypothetical protein